jgi:peptidoglycan hydrolase CwlO-like protein
MEQYKSEESLDTEPRPNKISDEAKQVQSIESKVRHLQETINVQQQELARLNREITRLKHSIDDVIAMVRNRG